MKVRLEEEMVRLFKVMGNNMVVVQKLRVDSLPCLCIDTYSHSSIVADLRHCSCFMLSLMFLLFLIDVLST